ncbi:anhydro-N-acetylmuramic acid kinase [Saccharopolyspora sp. CA-218241]|uniref:anhydro-N-acetylmuramic acid kinase n=1 Tax=Saccharopolyspora sp. CA-218241 TaxID=3240027 RepID=UPI003D971920
MESCRVLGILSGTSMDGIDVAAADLRLDGDAVELRPLGDTELPYPAELRERLLRALSGPCGAAELCRLDTEIGQAFADAARRGVELAGGRADLVASLGQTVHHWVEGGAVRGTLQLGQPAWIAEATGLPVLADLRVRDVAAGGHGAPLAAVLDALWLADEPGPVAALNIGGIANLTVVGGDRPRAYDTGPGNALLDLAAGMVSGARADVDGALAARGAVRPDLLAVLLDEPHYRRPPPKSTGKELFGREHLTRALAAVPPVEGPDLLATLTELTAATIADACRAERVRSAVVSGGGVRNPVLLAALRRRMPVPLRLSDELGLPAGSKEALLTALLGFLTWHGLPGTYPDATGATGPRLLGALTPGAGPLRLPAPADRRPRRLRIPRPTKEVPCTQWTS